MIREERLRILFAEDDPAHAEIVKRNLSRIKIQHEIWHVEDGVEVQEFLLHTGKFSDPQNAPTPHLILLDIRMPRMDGLETLKWIKAIPEFSQVPVVMLTSSTAETDVAEAYESKASSYLVKPVDFENFRQLMEQFASYWLEWNRYPMDSSSSHRA